MVVCEGRRDKAKGGQPSIVHTYRVCCCSNIILWPFLPVLRPFLHGLFCVQCFTNRLAYWGAHNFHNVQTQVHNPAILVSFQLTIQLMALVLGSEAKCENVKMAENSVTSR